MILVAAMKIATQNARAMRARDDATPRRILLTAEVAEYLHVSLATVHRLVRHSQIPAFKIGSEYRFYRDAIEKWMIDRQGR
jgi:excisionase family DNA binding protein